MQNKILGVAALSLLFAACNKEKSTEPTGEPPVDEIPAITSIRLDVIPDRVVYIADERVMIDAVVFNAKGERVEDAVVQWTQRNAERSANGEFRLMSRESVATIKGCVALEADPDSDEWWDADENGLIATDICDEVELAVDNGPPTLTVLSPDPGLELDRNEENGVVVVTGTVSDSNPEARLQVYVNDISVPIEADGSFSFEHPLAFGINRMTVSATDGFHDPVVQQFDLLAADGYLTPEEGSSKFVLQDTIGVRIGQKFFDKVLGGTNIDPTQFPVYADDLASIVEVLLANMDLSSLFGTGPVIEVENTISLSVTGVTVGDAIVDVAIVDQSGLELSLNINDVFVQTDGDLDLFDAHFDLEGGLRVDISGRLSIDLHIDEDEQITSSMTVHDFGISTIRPAFTGNDGEFFNALISLGSVNQTFRELVENEIGGELINEFLGVIPATITDLLGSIGGLLNGLSFDIDPGFAPPISIQLGSSLGDLSLVGGATTGYLNAALNASVEVRSDAGVSHPESRGLPMASISPVMPFNNISAIQLAIRQDFVNGLLHGVWNSGLLNSSINFSNIDITLDAKLPPVLTMAPANTTCRIDGVRCDALIQIGQLELVAFGTRLGVSLEAGATIAFNGNDIVLNVSEAPNARTWVIEGDATVFGPSLVETILLTVLWPEISGFIGEGFAFSLPLPSIESLGLADLAPALVDAQLNLRALGRINSQTGYLGLGADIVLTTP